MTIISRPFAKRAVPTFGPSGAGVQAANKHTQISAA
jgi:hypothetical protein